jgi:hypothetical protein
MGAVLGRGGGTDESMSPQFGINCAADITQIVRRLICGGTALAPVALAYAHTIDRLDKTREIVERFAAVEDLELAEATWRAAIMRWPNERIILQNRRRVIHDSGSRLSSSLKHQ